MSDPIVEAELASLRNELEEVARFPQASGYTSEPPVSDRTIIRLSVQKSWGGRAQIYLLIRSKALAICMFLVWSVSATAAR